MNGALNGYWTFCSRGLKIVYYHRVIIGVLRAVDFICALPQHNGQALGVTGSSQGGALFVMTASSLTRASLSCCRFIRHCAMHQSFPYEEKISIMPVRPHLFLLFMVLPIRGRYDTAKLCPLPGTRGCGFLLLFLTCWMILSIHGKLRLRHFGKSCKLSCNGPPHARPTRPRQRQLNMRSSSLYSSGRDNAPLELVVPSSIALLEIKNTARGLLADRLANRSVLFSTPSS